MRLASTFATLLVACGGSMGTDGGTAPDPDAGAADDAGPVEDGGGVAAAPFDGPAGEWVFTPIEGARCGNGSTLPVLVNRAPGGDGTERVLLYLQGGGACWDAQTCFEMAAASHIEDTLDEASLGAEAPSFSRTDGNPWATATWVYVPYCTGDLHAGQRVATYGGREVHHVGATNTELVLARLHATVPTPEQVWVAGASAGGYGATLVFWRVRARWPGVRVDALSDSGVPIDVVADRWSAMLASWDLTFPPGCADCADGLSRLLPHYAATIDEPYRYGLLAYDQDAVIALYFGLDGGEVRDRLLALRAAMAATEHQRSFVLAGDGHVVLGMAGATASDGTTVAQWLLSYATDDPAWDDAGP